MEETTVDIQPPAGSPTHPEPSRRSLKKQIVISLLCTSALVAAFATGRMTGSATSVDSAQDSLTNVGLRNQENSIQIRGSLPEELSEIWAAIDGLRTDTGTQNAAITNQLNQATADRQAALTQLNASLQTTFTNLEDLTTTTGASLSADLQQEISDRQQAVASATSTLQSSIDGLSTSFNADLATETAERDSADANLENILACRPGFIRDPNDSTKCIPCSENQFWSARTGGCSDCPAHSTATAGSTSCTCDAGFAETTDGQCEDVDECQDSTVCGANMVCANTEGSFTCQCDAGFVLEDGVCTSAGSISNMAGTHRLLVPANDGKIMRGLALDQSGDVVYTIKEDYVQTSLHKYHVSDGTTSLIAQQDLVSDTSIPWSLGWYWVTTLPNGDFVVYDEGVATPTGHDTSPSLKRITPAGDISPIVVFTKDDSIFESASSYYSSRLNPAFCVGLANIPGTTDVMLSMAAFGLIRVTMDGVATLLVRGGTEVPAWVLNYAINPVFDASDPDLCYTAASFGGPPIRVNIATAEVTSLPYDASHILIHVARDLDGTLIAQGHQNNNIYSIKADGTTTELTTVPFKVKAAALSPAGRYYMATSSNGLHVVE